MTQIYNKGTAANPSTIGETQFNDFYWQKKALIEASKEMYFGQLADTMSMPKHFGKTIKRYHYLPLLDDANINDQGIDAAGNQANYKATIILQPPGLQSGNGLQDLSPTANYVTGVDPVATSGENLIFLTGEGNSAGNALTDLQTQANLESAVLSAGHSLVTWTTDWATTIAAYRAAGWLISDEVQSDIAAFPYKAPVFDGGNLYGSSKDVGTISGKMPILSETGGRVNRVGFRRVELEGTLQKFGFFDEYTQESLDFDTDADLAMHINREMVRGANEMTEDALQIDLLNAAGIIRFGGAATQTSEVTGEGTISSPTYEDLMRLNIDLDDNRCPKQTKLITGSRMVDTKTVNGARYMYIGSELIPTVKKMKDLDASSSVGSGFVSVEKYAHAGTIARGEIGQVDQFKMIVVPEMMHWKGAGASVGTNAGYRETAGNYDVFPMLVVGSGSFTTVGFQTDGKSVKFKIKHVKPGSTQSYNFQDPYGELGFMSIKWYYGFMVLRPEHIALVKCVAEW